MSMSMAQDGTLYLLLDAKQRVRVTINGAQVEITNGVVGEPGPAPEIIIRTVAYTDYEMEDSQGVGIRKPDEGENIHVRIVLRQPEESDQQQGLLDQPERVRQLLEPYRRKEES